MSEIIPIKQEYEPQTSWGGVTNPSFHNPDSFRYLIHLDSGLPDNDTNYPSYKYLVDNPSGLEEAGRLSASLVDSNHRVLWQGTSSQHGYIIEVPEQAVIATSARDMYTKGIQVEEIQTLYPPQDPNELLAATPLHDHNEVLVATDQLEVKAIFWTNSEADDQPPYTREEVEARARIYGIPFIELDLIKY